MHAIPTLNVADYVPVVFPFVNFVLILIIAAIGLYFVGRKVDGKVELIIERLKHAAEHDDRREASLRELIGKFEEVMRQNTRTADACERSCAAVVETSSASRESVEAAKAIQVNSERMCGVVESLIRDVVKAIDDGTKAS